MFAKRGKRVSQAKITCRNIWKVFGPNPKRALETLDRNASRAAVQEETGHVVAVKDVTFDVHAGEAVALVGATGTGKSTLAASLAALHPVLEGEVTIGGVPVAELTTEERTSALAMAFQETFLFADTIPLGDRQLERLETVSMARAIDRIHRSESVSMLFESEQ